MALADVKDFENPEFVISGHRQAFIIHYNMFVTFVLLFIRVKQVQVTLDEFRGHEARTRDMIKSATDAAKSPVKKAKAKWAEAIDHDAAPTTKRHQALKVIVLLVCC